MDPVFREAHENVRSRYSSDLEWASLSAGRKADLIREEMMRLDRELSARPRGSQPPEEPKASVEDADDAQS